MNKIYFAGPDIFSTSWDDFKLSAAKLCALEGVEPVFPVDTPNLSHIAIAEENMRLISASDAVFANLMPFRGCEPDSGTVFEVGYGFALGKLVAATCGPEPMRKRIETLCGPCTKHSTGWPIRDANGFGVEGFGLPQNLMLVNAAMIFHDMEAAIEYLSQALQKRRRG